MKIEKIAHVHIVVKDIEKAAHTFSDLLGVRFTGPLQGASPMVAAFDDRLGLELQQPTSDEGYIANILAERGEGISAIGIKVTDIDKAIKELESKGVLFLNKGEKNNLKYAVTDPKYTHGVALELLEYQGVQDAPFALAGKTAELPWM